MTASIACRQNQNLYVLFNGRHYWLTTLATNRADSWKAGLKYAKDGRKSLEREGYKCVTVRLAEYINK